MAETDPDQQAETIRQLQERIEELERSAETDDYARGLERQIATLTQERDEARLQASLLSTAKAEIIDELEARCATLTAALEAYMSAFGQGLDDMRNRLGILDGIAPDVMDNELRPELRAVIAEALQAGDATPPAPSEVEVLEARRYFGGRLTGEEQAALDAVDLAGVNHAPATPPAEPPNPPHVREDYRDVWLSGWRAGRLAHPPAVAGEGARLKDAFRAGFLARCQRKYPDATDPAQILEMTWTFDAGGSADDLEPQAFEAWRGTTPTPGAE